MLIQLSESQKGSKCVILGHQQKVGAVSPEQEIILIISLVSVIKYATLLMVRYSITAQDGSLHTFNILSSFCPQWRFFFNVTTTVAD